MSVLYTVELVGGGSFGPADEATLRTWAQEGRIPPVARIIGSDGSSSRAIDCPPIQDVMARVASAPPIAAGPMPQDTDSGVSRLIPYKNMPALVGYYTSVAALIPLVGLIAGPVAVVLGVIGLKTAKANRLAHGRAHAWVAIILGSLAFLLYAGLILVPIIMAATK